MRASGLTVLIAGAAASILFASPRAASAQACLGEWEVAATQVGQDVRFEVTNEQHGVEGGLGLVVARTGTDGPIELRTDLENDGCNLTMPEPATGCGCWALSATVVETCVPPGTYEYTISTEYPHASAPEPPVAIETVTVTVADSGDDCLPGGDDDGGDGGASGGGGGSCAVAGTAEGSPALLTLALGALLVVRRSGLRGSRRGG